MKKYSLPSVCVFSFLALSPLSAATVISPYFQDFEEYPSDQGTDFFETNTGGFTVVTQGPSDQAYRARIAASTSVSATVQVVGSAAQNFSVSTQMTYSEYAAGTGANSINFALVAAANNQSVSGNGTSSYRILINFFDGAVALVKSGTLLGGASATGTVPTFTIGNTYTMAISGIYTSATSVDLTASVSDGMNTRTFTFTDGAAISGEHFGYRIAKNGTNTLIGVIVDDFSLTAVPEPSVSGLAALSALGLVLRRRR